MLSNLRAQLRKLFVEGNIKCVTMAKLKHLLRSKLLTLTRRKNILSTLTNIEISKMCAKKKSDRQKNEETKGYQDYNWEALYRSGDLKKVKVPERNKIKIVFTTTCQGEKCPNQKNFTFCQLTSAKVYVKDLDTKCQRGLTK